MLQQYVDSYDNYMTWSGRANCLYTINFGCGEKLMIGAWNWNFLILSIFSLSIESNLSINQVIAGRRHVGIMSAEPVGNYGVRYYNSFHEEKPFTETVPYYILMAVLSVIDVDYFSMTCIKQGSSHGITFIILVATSFRS